MERFRTCFYRPLLSTTDNFERWTRNGALDAEARSRGLVASTLEAYEPPPIDEGLRDAVRAFVDRRRRELGD